MLFEDPRRRSTNVGVTVSPVRIAALEQFGDVDAVAERLLGAERAKASAGRGCLAVRTPQLVLYMDQPGWAHAMYSHLANV